MNRYDTYNPKIDEPEEVVIEQKPETTKTAQRKERKRSSRKQKTEPSTAAQMAGDVKKFFTNPTLKLILGLFIFFFAGYLAVSCFSYLFTCIYDQSEINHSAMGMAGEISNKGGEGGARISSFLVNDCFGLGAFVIVFWMFVISLRLLGVKLRYKTVNFTIKCIVALVAVSLVIGLMTLGMNTPVNWGGLDGRYVNEFVIHFLGWTGAWMLSLFAVALFCVLCLRDFFKWIMRMRRKIIDKREAVKAEREAAQEHQRYLDEMNLKEKEEEATPDTIVAEEPQAESPETTDEEDAHNTVEFEKSFESYEIADDPDEEDTDAESDDQTADDEASEITDALDTDDNENTVTVSEAMRVNVNSISEQAKGKYPLPDGIPGTKPYKFPPYELMRVADTQICVDEEEQRINEEKIRSTLASFGIEIKSIEATVGPTVTLYEIMPDTGIRIARIRSLSDEIAMSLAAKANVRIIAPIPGKNTVGIEVGNRNPVTVSMRTIIKSRVYQESKYQLPVALGATISNEVYIADLAEMPHLLVAGATGQGKSVGLNAIVASLLYSKTPDELKFVMIDPKFVEFGFYKKIEHQYLAKLPGEENPIITEMQNVVPVLSSLCVEMDNRYQLLLSASCRKIKEYNAKICAGELDPKEGHRYLPFIVVIVDEFSDLMSTAGKEVEKPIVRLAQKARAVGIHVIIATQRPSTDVITGVIKANFPARIAFKVTNGIDSKTILNSTSAYQLIGRGDMLVSHKGELVRVQCAFIDTPEVEEICDYISRQPYPRGAYILPEPPATGDSEPVAMVSGERDPLFEQAARIVVNANTASTSSLQRRYSIGYNRAAKIMDQLEAAGIVGPSMDGKPRNVLVDEVSLERILAE